MTIRAWHVVLPLVVVVWLASTWGMALVVFLLSSWASFVLFGGLREGVIMHGVRNPLKSFGEEQPPGIEEGARAP